MEDVLSRTSSQDVVRTPPEPIGRSLVAAGLLTEERLAEALEIQRSTGSPLGHILVAQGWLRPFDFYRHLAAHHGMRFVNMETSPIIIIFPPDACNIPNRPALRHLMDFDIHGI